MAFRIGLLSLLGFHLSSSTLAHPQQSVTTRSACENTPQSRSCWATSFDIDTNYYEEWPDTGRIVEYSLNIAETVLSPDGVPRPMITANGVFPGPTLEADWGDTLVVHVTNSLPNNGTAIHFHGVRQLNNNQNDGVPSVTQCPIAPGKTMTYTWKATQYGSSWYHSHWGLQAWDGVAGGIVIHGPATSNYDEDLGILVITDWSHETAVQLYPGVLEIAFSIQDNGLINGTNTWQDKGQRWEVVFQPGKKYLMRIVNVSVDHHFKFSIDGHTLTVIAADFVPIKPFTTTILNVGIAQRYDVIVNADALPGNYWLRAFPALLCDVNKNPSNIKGIIRYDMGSSMNPTTLPWPSLDINCDDETQLRAMEPCVALSPGLADEEGNIDVETFLEDQKYWKWQMNSTSFRGDWGNPTILQVHEGILNFTQENDVIKLERPNEWAYFVIETDFIFAHPIHLHGHDFYLLAQGTGKFDASTPLNITNPLRRDTAMLPLSGYMVMAFKADNPGAWLMHCHIGWHVESGLALQFLELPNAINATLDADQLTSTCIQWNDWQKDYNLIQDINDSGV